MPHRTGRQCSEFDFSRERARRFLRGGGVIREDSDDELGLEDHPWQWIHSQNHGELDPTGKQEKIIGARMGTFQCMLGDCVLLKAEGMNEAWIGLICEFLEDEEDDTKAANFMWFSTEKEIRNKQKKRFDALPNELYITPSWDINPLASINGKALVVSSSTFFADYPTGKVPRASKDFGKIFVCRRGCNTRTATYTEEFQWEDVYHGSERDLDALIERVKTQTKATRKRRRDDHLSDDTSLQLEEEYVRSPKTPSKRQKTHEKSTPKAKASERVSLKYTTPTHKRVIVKRPLEFTPLGTRILSSAHVSSSPFQIARTRLHVSSVPTALPCREKEFAIVYSHLEAAISAGSGTCIYISGTPGTGKTATVREVVAQLNASVSSEELDDFVFVEINGMKVTDPRQSYSLLWEALRGDRVSPSHALDLLEREFSNPSPRRVPCVVLMDELDQLVTKNQSVMYNFFNWPGLRHSRLIVLAVANTMDLPERTLSNKISSRLGLTRITFPGYTYDQLMKIIQSRLEGVPGSIVNSDAVQFASRKVAAVSGDARRVLDICRRAIEIAEIESPAVDAVLESPSKEKNNNPSGNPQPRKDNGKVVIATIKQAIFEATSNPMQQSLKNLALASKLILIAMVAKLRRSGLGECLLGDIIDEARRLNQLADNDQMKKHLLADSNTLQKSNLSRRGPTSMISRVLGMGIAVSELAEAGIIGLEPRKGERTSKVRMNIAEEDVKLALKDDEDLRGLGNSA